MTPKLMTIARPESDLIVSRTAPAIDRRRLLGIAAAAGAAMAWPPAELTAAANAAAQGQGISIPPDGHTWLLDSPSALRPDDPGAPTETEIDELLTLQGERDDGVTRTIEAWASEPAVVPWLDLGMQLSAESMPPGLFRLRVQSLLTAAMSDAVVAARDAQEAIARPAPSEADDRIEPTAGNTGAGPSFPSLHAAVAGAASTVLAYLFPDASDDEFGSMADEAAMSRIQAGASYRSDVEAGLMLGRNIGDLAVQRGETDNSDAEWDGTGWPTGDGLYESTPPNFADPFQPLGGTWATWVLPSGDALRPAPFPAYGSPAWNAEVSLMQRTTANRTPEQERAIDFWLGMGPERFYLNYAQNLIERHALDEAEAASILAMISVAMYDGVISTWDAKFHYWIARPITADPSLDLYVPSPPYPSYPAGFSNACGAGAAVLADLFPSFAPDLYATAWEGASQRHWSGVHYVLDNEVALMMGGQIGRITVDAVRAGAAV